MTKKTIGIDARFYNEAGPGRYVKAIIQHLEKIDSENIYIIFLRKKGYEAYEPQNPNFKKILAPYKWYTFEEQTLFLFTLLKHKLDILYVPHFNIPIFYPKKLVTAIPDIIMHTFSTKKATTRSKITHRIKKLGYYLAVLIAVVRSKKVIVPSNTVKNDFLKHYKFTPESKYVVAYEGVDPDLLDTTLNSQKVLEKYNIKTPFLLYISSMYEHKNVHRLLDAFKILKEKYNFTGQLVLIGKEDYFSQKIYERVQKENLTNQILMPGTKTYVTDEEIVALRKKASVYTFPSLMEGFSLTPLEGMAVGLPAVISDIPCHREIYKDAVIYFDPYKPQDMAEKINSVLRSTKTREILVEKGHELVKQYSWDKTAEITQKIFQNV